MDDYDINKYYLTAGTVQPSVVRIGDIEHRLFSHHFGRAEYDKYKPVISESIRAQAQPIVDQLNAGMITEAEAIAALDKIYW